jgi:hypothetical protein
MITYQAIKINKHAYSNEIQTLIPLELWCIISKKSNLQKPENKISAVGALFMQNRDLSAD